MPFFGRKYEVIRRTSAGRENGRAKPPLENSGHMSLNVQAASVGDYGRTMSVAGGRRYTDLRKAYGDKGPNQLRPAGTGVPGDLVVIEGARWLVIGVQARDSIPGAPTSGLRYLLAPEVEHAAGEVTA